MSRNVDDSGVIVNGETINGDAPTLATTTATISEVSAATVVSIRIQNVGFTATMTVTDTETVTAAVTPSSTTAPTPSSITAFTPPQAPLTTVLAVSYSVLTIYDTLSTNTGSSRKTTPAVIAGSVVGSIASAVVLILLFVLWRRRKSLNRASNNASGDNDAGMTSVPRPILTPILISATRAESIASELSDIPRRLSPSSRTEYEEEIGRLRQQIMYMEEEMELTYSGSAPPSYRSSSRSDASDLFNPSLSTPPPLPSRELPH
ncbi:hypothetical protein ARMGADRAFT_1061724 [Armillaria gallica]|uniref:Mid2 domain-containing protein n=1 Tax=Armillaria gallica TaxID=47427 RepID=A0A2H3DPF0_ARMGA|nr:hypothetical protein ARMGADRAFT_1061724 [Armillaria gallica]